jgi:hypothetical protein
LFSPQNKRGRVCDAKVNFAVGLPVVRTNVIDEAGQLGSAALQNLPRRQIANLSHADNYDNRHQHLDIELDQQSCSKHK